MALTEPSIIHGSKIRCLYSIKGEAGDCNSDKRLDVIKIHAILTSFHLKHL